jgi:hypothetical protein
MPTKKTHSKFYAALADAAPSSSRGPVNSGAILRDKHLVLEKASSLLGYQNYLTQARAWKAARKSVPLSFEREVQAQAKEALADARELAAGTLRTTKHLKQAGELDCMLDTWIAGVKASGPVQVQDLWSDLEDDPEARQVLRDEGLTDELWTAISENIKKVEGRLFLQGGKLAGEVKVAGQDRARTVVFAHSSTGMPRTVSELLRRGQFERMVEQFGRAGVLPMGLDVVAGEAREVEIADVVLSGAVLSVQMTAQHKRKLEDTGLATYAGNEPATILLLGGLLLIVTGLIISGLSCGDNDHENLCTLGKVLMILGLLATGGGWFALSTEVGVLFSFIVLKALTGT